MKILKKLVENKIEDIIIKWKLLVCLLFSIAITSMYYYGLITDIKGNLGNIVALLSAMLVVITLILTLLLYLNDKEKYQKAISNFGTKDGKNMIYQYVYRIIIANVMCIIIAILIGVLHIGHNYIKIVITFIGVFVFCYLLIGTIYMLWFAIDIVGSVNKKPETKVK